MGIHFDDFQSLYRRYAYSLYREVFEELRDIEETREVMYRVFARLREEDFQTDAGLEERLLIYQAEYVAAQKRARLDVGRVWYQLRNDEVMGRERGTEPMLEAVPAAVPKIQGEAAAEPEGLTGKAAEAGVEIQAAAKPEFPDGADAAPSAEAPEEGNSWADPGLLAGMRMEAAVPAMRCPEPTGEAAPEIDLSGMSLEELLADINRRGGHTRRIREVFPDEIEAAEGEAAAAEDGGAAVVGQEIREETVSMAGLEPEAEEDRGGTGRDKPPVSVALWILMGCVALIFVWFALNVLMTMGVLPVVDLGYSWFNGHIVSLFPVP